MRTSNSQLLHSFHRIHIRLRAADVAAESAVWLQQARTQRRPLRLFSASPRHSHGPSLRPPLQLHLVDPAHVLLRAVVLRIDLRCWLRGVREWRWLLLGGWPRRVRQRQLAQPTRPATL